MANNLLPQITQSAQKEMLQVHIHQLNENAVIKTLKKYLPESLTAISLCIFLYLFTRHAGIGVSPDSVTYSSVALNICKHFSFTDFNGAPLVDFPLGYPSFLGWVSWLTGDTALQAAPFINMALISGVAFLTATLLRKSRSTSAIYSLLFLSVLACSPALLEVYAMLWSETLFIFLSLLFLVLVHRYLQSHTTASLLSMSLVAALAFVTRYAAMSLVLTGLFLLFFDGALTLRKKIQHLLVFGISSCSLVLLNLVHNHYTTTSLAGVREKALRSITENISQISDTVGGWLPFINGHHTASMIVFLLITISSALLLLYYILQQQYYTSCENIVTTFFVVYIFFLIAVASVSRFEDLSSRLLSPVYIPLFLVLGNGIGMMEKRLTVMKQRLLLSLCIVFFAALHYHQYQLNAEAWEGIKDAGVPGYTEDSWKSSATVNYIKQHKDSLAQYPLYSDAYDGVYFLSGLHSLPLPHKEIETEINSMLNVPDFCVIWLNDGFNPDLVDIDFIQQHKKLVSTTRFDDGAIFFFSNDTLSLPLKQK